MCYNPKISLFFFFIGFFAVLYIQILSPRLRSTKIQFVLLFYSFMELLQSIQYHYVNQCDNKINVFLTEIAYIFVIVQPLIWNFYFYINSNIIEKQIFFTAIVLSLCWMAVNLTSRFLYKSKLWPHVQTKQNSLIAGDRVCTKAKLTSHLYWEWTSANFFELNANFLQFLLLWFIPGLLVAKHRIINMIVAFSAILAGIVSVKKGETFTFISLWCYVSVPTVLATLFGII
jgi:hypothetical protein